MRFCICVILYFISFFIFCQNDKEGYNFVFIDTCSKNIINPEYDIESFKELNYDLINIYVNRGDWVANYSTIIRTKVDTIRIPKLLFSFERVLHSNKWAYFKCDVLCEGNIIDYYENGNKRIEGFFENGKPKDIIEYNTEGKKTVRYFYDFPKLSYKRINYYDKNEVLEEYELYVYKKRRVTKKLYTKEGKLLNKEIEKL